MTYEVRLQPPAENDLAEAYLRAARHAPETALLWLTRFHEALQSLAEHPERCGLAPEHKQFAREIRQLLFGRKPNVFRAVFLIEGDTVRIIRIRRASQRNLTRKDIGLP